MRTHPPIYKLSPVADAILGDVTRAMQSAEEIDGPDREDYVALMRAIAFEATRRADVASEERYACPSCRPTCPVCGEPARVVIVHKARVRCRLQADGSIGEFLSASRDRGSALQHECGGGHLWGAS